MRSIRLSLIVYFLVLLAVALGGVSWFVYQTTARTLRGRQAVSIHDLIEAEYKSKCEDIKTALDRRILRQAQALARKARFREHFEPLFTVGLFSTSAQPQGYLNAPLWLASGLKQSLAQYLYRMREFVIEDADDIIPLLDPNQHQAQEFFQTNNWTGQIQQRSEKLAGRKLHLDERMREKAELITEQFDTLEPEPGWKLRRVTLKWPVSRFRFGVAPFAWRNPPPGAKNTGVKGPALERRPGGFDRPEIFVQYASETSLMDQKLGEFLEERDAKFAQMVGETDDALASLRLHLLGICLATFAAIVAGGMVLVRRGLAPLSRLSEAVSQISEKDFRLKMPPQDLPKELQPIAARLTDTLEQLKRAFAREKQAAEDISHELRTPLAAMMTTLELSLRKSRTAAEYREMLEDIRASGAQLTNLVERLLALARLDAGAVPLKAQDIDAREVARECTNMIRPLAEARGLALRLHAPDPAPLQTDPDKLREILNNLLHNAVEYNRPEGAIDLNVARVNGHVCLAVSDTGIGITPEQRDHIFERFFRVDPSRHADTPHAGLGLSIVKSYVDLMGGTIGVDSSAQGSTFTIEFPAFSKRG